MQFLLFSMKSLKFSVNCLIFLQGLFSTVLRWDWCTYFIWPIFFLYVPFIFRFRSVFTARIAYSTYRALFVLWGNLLVLYQWIIHLKRVFITTLLAWTIIRNIDYLFMILVNVFYLIMLLFFFFFLLYFFVEYLCSQPP